MWIKLWMMSCLTQQAGGARVIHSFPHPPEEIVLTWTPTFLPTDKTDSGGGINSATHNGYVKDCSSLGADVVSDGSVRTPFPPSLPSFPPSLTVHVDPHFPSEGVGFRV